MTCRLKPLKNRVPALLRRVIASGSEAIYRFEEWIATRFALAMTVERMDREKLHKNKAAPEGAATFISKSTAAVF
jgi:hypothetical protein